MLSKANADFENHHATSKGGIAGTKAGRIAQKLSLRAPPPDPHPDDLKSKGRLTGELAGGAKVGPKAAAASKHKQMQKPKRKPPPLLQASLLEAAVPISPNHAAIAAKLLSPQKSPWGGESPNESPKAFSWGASPTAASAKAAMSKSTKPNRGPFFGRDNDDDDDDEYDGDGGGGGGDGGSGGDAGGGMRDLGMDRLSSSFGGGGVMGGTLGGTLVPSPASSSSFGARGSDKGDPLNGFGTVLAASAGGGGHSSNMAQVKEGRRKSSGSKSEQKRPGGLQATRSGFFGDGDEGNHSGMVSPLVTPMNAGAAGTSGRSPQSRTKSDTTHDSVKSAKGKNASMGLMMLGGGAASGKNKTKKNKEKVSKVRDRLSVSVDFDAIAEGKEVDGEARGKNANMGLMMLGGSGGGGGGSGGGKKPSRKLSAPSAENKGKGSSGSAVSLFRRKKMSKGKGQAGQGANGEEKGSSGGRVGQIKTAGLAAEDSQPVTPTFQPTVLGDGYV